MPNSRDCDCDATVYFSPIKRRDSHLRTLVSVSDAYRRSVMHEMGLVVIDRVVARMEQMTSGGMIDVGWKSNERG